MTVSYFDMHTHSESFRVGDVLFNVRVDFFQGRMDIRWPAGHEVKKLDEYVIFHGNMQELMEHHYGVKQ